MTSQPFIPPLTPMDADESNASGAATIGTDDRDADVARSKGEPVPEGTDTALTDADTGLVGDGADSGRDSDGVPVGRDDARADAARSGADPDQV